MHQSSITRNRALIIPERIIAACVNAKRCHAQLDGSPHPKAFLPRENISSPAEFEKALGRARNTLLIRDLLLSQTETNENLMLLSGEFRTGYFKTG